MLIDEKMKTKTFERVALGLAAITLCVRQRFLAALRMPRTNNGFTLIEIALVLVVVGLVTSVGLSFAGKLGEGSKRALTQTRMDEVHRALLGFVISQGCLPCPANPALSTGLQLPNATPCDAAGCTNATGAVPWVTLGLSEEIATDGWDRRFTYSIANELHTQANTATPSGLTRGTGGAFPANIVVDANEIVIENATGTILAGGTSAAPIGNKDIAYIIVSHGPDGAFGFTRSGGQMPDAFGQAATGVGQGENGNGNRTFAIGEVNSQNNVNRFDDIAVYRSAQALILSCGAGSCGNPN